MASPLAVFGRERAPDDLFEAMARRNLGSALWSPQAVYGREGAPEELSEPTVRLIRGSVLWRLPKQFPGESGAL